MNSNTTSASAPWITAEDMIAHLGVPASRIRMKPTPGTAVEEDVLRVQKEEGKLCELIDGVLVEKTMGYGESNLALWLGHLLHNFLEANDLGSLTGPDGTMRLQEGQVRIPDVAFMSHEREAECSNIDTPIPDIAPDLAVEILNEANTPAEINRKLKDYFFAGTQLAWIIDPRKFTVKVYTTPDASVLVEIPGELTGEPVLPGLRIPLTRLFEKLKPPTQAKRPRRKKNP